MNEERIIMVQLRGDGGLKDDGSCDNNQMDLEYILKAEPIRLVHELHMRYKEKRNKEWFKFLACAIG